MHMYYSILIIRFLILGSVLLVAKPILGSPSSTSSTTAGGTTTSTSTIPRSSNTRHFLSQQQPFSEDDETFFPPWNPSQKIDDDGFLVDIYCCVPGEWEQETTVGGRYADLRKKSRFLFGVSNTNPSGTTTTTNGRNNPAAAASRTSIPFGGSLRSSSTRSTSPSRDGLGTPSITSTTYPSSSELHNNNNNNMQHDILEETSEFLMCRVRQVPGDGNCLFHSVSACLSMAENRTHIDMRNTTHLRRASAFLREQAVEFLQKHPRRLLFLQGKESWPARDLLEAAASQFNISGEEYCHLMKQDAYWGGGPEIVALSNFLCRPIHVYKLACEEPVTSASQEEGGRFVLQRMACFGSPKFDRKEPLHILSADSRFPDISPGRQLPIGNHFLALFPYSSSRRRMRKGQ